MGAVAPLTQWIPEDDVLLKNAVEAGASLECLARGAVPFSRRFSVRELQDRWHSLLYNPKISEEASARMIEVEMEVPMRNYSKSKKSCGFNGKRGSGKRKVDSVRSHYYAMRKRICSEPNNNLDCDFLMRSGECTSEHVNPKIQAECPVGKCISGVTSFSGGSTSIHFKHLETGINTAAEHAFPVMHRTGASAPDAPSNPFHCCVDTRKVKIPDEILDQDKLYGFAENVSFIPINNSVGNGLRNSCRPRDAGNSFPRMPGENLESFGNRPEVSGMVSAQTSPADNLFGSEDLNLKLDLVDNKHDGLCSGFRGLQDPSSSVLDGGVSYHQLGCSSEHPVMPIWERVEDISTLNMPKLEKVDTPGFDLTCSDPKLNAGICADGLDNPMAFCEGDLIELQNSLLNFGNDELMYLDVESKDMSLDGLSSILLSSPNDEHGVDMPDSSGPEAVTPVHSHHVISDGTCIKGPVNPSDRSHSVIAEVCCKANDPKIDLAEAIVQNSHSLQPCKEIMICVLNTEDTEIPCNDEVYVLTEDPLQVASSEVQNNTVETSGMDSFSTKVFPDSLKGSGKGFNGLMIKDETLTKIPAPSLKTGMRQEMDSMLTDGKRLRKVLSDNYSIVVASRQLGNAGRDTSPAASASADLQPSLINVPGKDVPKFGYDRHNLNNSTGSLNKALKGPGNAKIGSVEVDDGRGANMTSELQKCASLHVEQASMEDGFLDAEMILSTLHQDEQLPNRGDDSPYFSDIETLILDMDLDIDTRESCLTKEVSNYQNNNTKKAIIRLEQGARAYMQRAIASHGAFAVIYGRRMKHYIKKTEVSLGRGAEDIHVDIDLGREGRANKISRRQATIKMTEDGSFFIKNIGRHSIFVNGKEVMNKQHLKLSSGCLIEMRGMAFIFEVNQKSAVQYLINVSKRGG
ncbi:hypothetical protein QJS04_geneDACA008947 [Acorus gramineus]|uniref:FHA domain-containing protein n=1 Tax=Acorus gramineus TaxID=55184 RepID=A0AAV9AFA1_ACOGR|nr:hypothetical protein QJS04_geneDACA008947 [Acorus gramineus]